MATTKKFYCDLCDDTGWGVMLGDRCSCRSGRTPSPAAVNFAVRLYERRGWTSELTTESLSRLTAGELSALIEAMKARPELSPPTPLVGATVTATPAPPTHRPNTYGGKCGTCGVWVEPGAGRLVKAGLQYYAHHVGACPPPPPPMPEGIYSDPAGMFYVVREDKYRKGKQWFGRLLGRRWSTTRGLPADAKMIDWKAARAHGLSSKFCIACLRDLSDPVSQVAGYGPVCAKNHGWPRPTPAEAEAHLNGSAAWEPQA